MTYGVNYVFGPVTTARTVYAVRIQARIKQTGTGFVSSVFDVLFNGGALTLATATSFLPAEDTTERTTFTNLSFTFRIDGTSLWTAAAVSGTWGFLFTTNCTGASVVEVSEFYLEVLTTEPNAPHLLVIDSLTVGLKSTSAITPVVTIVSGPVTAGGNTHFKYRKKLVASVAEVHEFDFATGLPCWDNNNDTSGPGTNVLIDITAAGGTITYTVTVVYHFEKRSQRTD
jgi:hypothetical protein